MAMEIRSITIRCPKCKSQNLTVTELWKDHCIDWDIDNGVFDKNDGSLNPGDPYKVVAKCKDCKHRWSIRGAQQIYDIIAL